MTRTEHEERMREAVLLRTGVGRCSTCAWSLRPDGLPSGEGDHCSVHGGDGPWRLVFQSVHQRGWLWDRLHPVTPGVDPAVNCPAWRPVVGVADVIALCDRLGDLVGDVEG